MLCEKCKKNEATGHYEGTKNGVKTVMRLCTRCLLDKQKELFGDLNMFSGFVGAPVQKMSCPSCGTDLKAVAKTLFVGCSECYGAFGEMLNPIIKNIQNGVTHVGSAPSYAADTAENEAELLREKLNAAIKEERYEDAAAISRRLKSLKEGK